jgi:hypothetical protein
MTSRLVKNPPKKDEEELMLDDLEASTSRLYQQVISLSIDLYRFKCYNDL